MTSTQISKQDYLKKYLSEGDKKKKKKKKKVTQSSAVKSKIIDDDIDLRNMQAVDSDDLEIYDLAEEAPQIVGIVDERPEEIRLMSEYRTKKWKVVADEFGIEDVKITEAQEENGTAKKGTRRESEAKADSDASPPRRIKKEKSDSDASPPRKSAKNCDSDASPPRKSRRNCDSDASPPRKPKRRKSDSDASPPRKTKKDKSPTTTTRRRRKSRKRDSNSPVRVKKEKSDSDASPPRKVKKEKASSSERAKKKEQSKRRKSDSDPSPQRHGRPKHGREKGGERKRRSSRRSRSGSGSRHERPKEEDAKARSTLEGKKSGLQNAEELRKEIDEMRERQKEESAMATGRNEAVVVRDKKTGQRIDPKEEARKRREKEEKEAEKMARYAVWGKGVKQVQDTQDKLADDLYEMSKPLARYADDKDLDDMLRNKEWEGDPMLEYIRSKRRKKGEASGQQQQQQQQKQQYEGSYMPNRYGIRPGHRWDGVDRSNGYEKKWFDEQNAKKAREEEAFKWSTADM